VAGGIDVRGLREFRSALKSANAAFPKELAAVHRAIANDAASRARSEARGAGGQQAKYADSIKGRGTERRIRISVGGKGGARAAFFGAKRHSGWYGWRRYRNSETPQFPKWVGNGWEVAQYGEGPYSINPALARYLPEILDRYVEMLTKLSRKAFPEGAN